MTFVGSPGLEGMLMNDNNLYSLNNFDFLARSFARMWAEGHEIDIHALTGNMDEEHRIWFCKRYERYCQQATLQKVAEQEH